MKVKELIEALGQHPPDCDVHVHLEPNAEEHMGQASVSESLTHVSESHGMVYTVGVAVSRAENPINLNN